MYLYFLLLKISNNTTWACTEARIAVLPEHEQKNDKISWRKLNEQGNEIKMRIWF